MTGKPNPTGPTTPTSAPSLKMKVRDYTPEELKAMRNQGWRVFFVKRSRPTTPPSPAATEEMATPARMVAAEEPGDLLRAVYGGYGQIRLATMLLAFADQAAAANDERTVLDWACESWFGGDYQATIVGYRRLVAAAPTDPPSARPRPRPVPSELDDTALASLLDRLKYTLKLRTALDLIVGYGEEGDARSALDCLCLRCFGLEYKRALEAYWRLFPYGLPFESEAELPDDA